MTLLYKRREGETISTVLQSKSQGGKLKNKIINIQMH